MRIVQVRLTQTVDEKFRKEMVTWVDHLSALKQGVQIELKGDAGVWTVAEIYKGEHEYKEFDWHRNWTNNV